MPVYEYECKKCGRNFEVDQRIIDPPLDTCRICGGPVERLISRCSFVLKGDGWYVTDYPSKDRKKAMEKGKKPQTQSETEKTGSKSEVKAENKTAPAPSASPTSAS